MEQTDFNKALEEVFDDLKLMAGEIFPDNENIEKIDSVKDDKD